MMEIDEDDLLRTVASSGSMDYSVWPALLPRIVARIDKIAHEAFPIPQLPAAAAPSPSSSVPHHPPAPASDSDTENFLAPIPSSPTAPASTASSQDATKPNSPAASRNAPPPTSVPAAAGAGLAAAPEPPLPPGALPPQVTAMLAEITTTLSATFPTYPPHTVQRLAELLLTPNHHYKSLPSYLHALDRVVHVTSGLNVYPLPPAVPDASSVSLLLPNGASDTILPSPFAAPGSDEALGGALLTPIPWLQTTGPQARAPSPQPRTDSPSSSASAAAERANDAEAELRTESTETIDGPNGMGSIETVTVTLNGVPSMGARGVGVTQGELLRQEQRAGVVPVSQLVPTHHIHHSHHGQLQQQPQPQQRSPPQQQQQQNPASANTSPASSATLGQTPPESDQDGDAEADAAAAPTTGVAEDEKPHARGPEEIGPEDMGPQRETSTQANYAAGSGADMQGIDVEAAVGRKADETRTSPEASEKDSEQFADSAGQRDVDEMEGIETGPERVKPSTPKREAEDELAGTSKKLRDDGDAPSAPGQNGAGEGQTEEAREAEGEAKD